MQLRSALRIARLKDMGAISLAKPTFHNASHRDVDARGGGSGAGMGSFSRGFHLI